MSGNKNIVSVSGPTYSSITTCVLPLTCSIGKLDLPDNADFASAYPSGSDATIGNDGVTVRLLGGSNVVTSLGSNLENFLRSKTWDGYTIASDAPISIASAGTVTRVQQLATNFLASPWQNTSYKVSQGKCDSTDYVSNSFAFLFLKPLVLQTIGSNASTGQSGPICITLQSLWST